MKTMHSLLIFFLSILIFIGCGNSVKKTELKVSIAAVTGSSSFPGGLYLFAKNDSGKNLIQQVPVGETLSLELDNGIWDFAVVGWDGVSSAFSGNSYCDNKKGIRLDGVTLNLPLDATQAKCTNFATPESLTTGSFSPLKIFSCMDIKPHLDLGENVDATMSCSGGGDGGGPGPGGDISFKVSIFTKGPLGTSGIGLSSACINGPGSLSSIKFPHGNAGIQIPVKIEAFPAAGCVGTSTPYVFPNGLNANAVNNLGQSAVANNSSVNIYLHVDMCMGAQLEAQPFAATYGSGDSHLICTANQFINIGLNGTETHSFELGQDIDFANLTSTPISNTAYIGTPFKGSFRGEYKKVLNGDRALFDIIEEFNSGVGERQYIANILMDNFHISQNAIVSGQSFGIFVNEIQNLGSSELEISNIHLLRTNSINIAGDFAGHVGGFAGLVEHTNNNNNNMTFIRMIQSLADVTTTNSSDSGQYVGGLFGKVLSLGVSNGSGLALEVNDVGKLSVPYLNNLTDSKQVHITGFKNVGGIAGGMHKADFRGLNTAHTKISSHGDSGGVIGTVDMNSSNSHNQLAGVKVDFEYEALSPIVHNIGGVVGDIFENSSSDQSFYIAAAVVKFNAPSNGKDIHSLGGIVGNFESNGYGDLKLFNVKADVNFAVDGDLHGGLIGGHVVQNITPGLTGTSLPTISYSVAQGHIGNPVLNSTTQGEFKGGFVGHGIDSDVYRSIANIDIYGEGKLGGGIGHAEDSVIYESHLEGLLEVTGTSTFGTFVGGAFGKLSHSFNQNLIPFNISKTNFDIHYNNIASLDCQSASCGRVIGGLSTSHNSSLTFFSIGKGVISDTATADLASATSCGTHFGSQCPGTFSIYTRDLGSESSDATFACSAIGTNGPFELDTNSVCVPTFEKRWREYGHNPANTNYEYLAGNQVEPFGISTVAAWNGISDDSFLMSKSFALLGNIDFGNTSPNSIGSNINPFDGSIYGNTFELQNINFTATTGKSGIIANMKSGVSIGSYKEALKVKNLTINCGSESGCGFIGKLGNFGTNYGEGDSEVNISITAGSISGSSDCTGGLIGHAMSSARFNKSSFQGDINVAAQGVGGFIGCVSYSGTSSGGSFDGPRIDIDESYVDLDEITGDNYVGGFIGDVQNTSSQNSFISFKRSYVVIDKTGAKSSSSLNGIEANGGSFVSGLIGGIDLNSSGLNISEVYVDTSTAKLPADYRPIARKSAGNLDGSDFFDKIGLVWNTGASSSSFYLVNSDSVPGVGGISFEEASVTNLIISGSSGNAESAFEASTEGHEDWYYPAGSRILMLRWQDPNFTTDN